MRWIGLVNALPFCRLPLAACVLLAACLVGSGQELKNPGFEKWADGRLTGWQVAAHLAEAGASPPRTIQRDQLGRDVKLRILVDKVMQPTKGWVTEEWMVKAAADAGFNVFSPRSGHERLDEVRQVAAWCQHHGIYYMPWMRGSLSAPGASVADGKRLVWAGGGEQALWSPNSDEFWQWTGRYIVEYAKTARENRHLIGVFLDYESSSERLRPRWPTSRHQPDDTADAG